MVMKFLGWQVTAAVAGPSTDDSVKQRIMNWLHGLKGEDLESAAISGEMADKLGNVVALEMARQNIREEDLKFDDWPADLPGEEISAEEMAKRNR